MACRAIGCTTLRVKGVDKMFWRIGVYLAKQNGLFFRLGDEQESDDVQFEENFLTYPDRDVKQFRIFGRDDEEDSWSYKTFDATPSSTANLSYVALEGALETADLDEDTITNDDLNNLPQVNEKDVNKVLVSETYRPRFVLGRRLQTVGDGASDGVLRFAVNAEEISSGQFGQYPAFAFCQRSRFAMEVGSDGVAFARISPDEVNRGIIGRNGAVNVGKTIVYLATDGLWTVPARERPLSEPIQDSALAHDLLANINEATGLAYYRDPGTGREEIWIATNNRVYAYSLKHGVWFTIGITRSRFVPVMSRTIGIGADGKMYEENGLVFNAVQEEEEEE